MLNKSTRKKVVSLLNKYPKTRDSDDYLVAMYWYKELGTSNLILKLNGLRLLEHISKSKLTNHDTITRCRRKLQEVNVNLRGDSYSKRKHKLVNDTLNQLNDKGWKYGRE